MLKRMLKPFKWAYKNVLIKLNNEGAEPSSVEYNPKISEELFGDFNLFRDLTKTAYSLL